MIKGTAGNFTKMLSDFQNFTARLISKYVVKVKDHTFQTIKKLECGPMPNVMAALPIISSALCSTPQSLADAHYQSAVQ